jgi:anti-sigma regulatory factor (Ser/Thr protein kinase)
MRAADVTSVCIAGGRGAPRVARGLVDDLALPAALRADMRLLVSELVANCVVHGGAMPDDLIDVVFTVRPGAVRCEVSDSGPGIPSRSIPPCEPVGDGRGLRLVDRIAARWGVRQRGNSVWFEIATDAS